MPTVCIHLPSCMNQIGETVHCTEEVIGNLDVRSRQLVLAVLVRCGIRYWIPRSRLSCTATTVDMVSASDDS